MEKIFLGFLNRGIVAGWIILAVILLRVLLKRAPKWMHCLLWAMVAVRLACPFSLESIFSLIPSRETVAVQRYTTAATTETVIDSGIRFVDQAVNRAMERSAAPTPTASADPLQIWLFAGSIIWIVGSGILILYALVSCIRLYLRVRTAVRLEGQIMQSEFVDTPFIFGILRPRIYLPSGMSEELRNPVVAHELAHLKRHDNLWKALGFCLLAVYWFQPLCWLAYILFCRDIELACDEKVIQDYDMHQKKVYSEALLACSMDRRTALVCPLAFGEVGVKERIKSVLHYKKPAFWVMAAAVVACVVAAVCLLTDPVKGEEGSGKAASASTGNNGGGIQEKDRDVNDISGGEADRGSETNGSMTDSGDGIEGSNGEGWDSNGSAGNGNSDDGSNMNGGTNLSTGEGTDNRTGNDSGNTRDTADAQAALREAFVKEWAAAFVGRDGNAIESMMTESLASDMLEGPRGERTFGFSSPWPMEAESDTYILNIGEKSAQVRYYAWTSEPHVTAWLETISYELQEENYVVTAEELQWLDDISTGEAFGLAYGDVPIDGSPMDYESNGAGESLNFNALVSSSLDFHDLFEPESAAAALLNLSDDPAKVKIERLYEESNAVNLEITFLEDEISPRITMVRPFGELGIWIPKDYRVDVVARLRNADWEEITRRNPHVSDRPVYDWSNDINCIAELPEEGIKMYGYADQEWYGDGVAIEMDGERYFFDWPYISPHGILPDCYWDAQGERLQTAMRIYTGTGVNGQKLYILQKDAAGTMRDYALEFDDYCDMLQERIVFSVDEENHRLLLSDARNQKELMVMDGVEEKVESVELGCISDFLLGETIWLSVDPGYFPEGSPIAEYPGGRLEVEIILLESNGEIQFELGEIRAVEEPMAD